MPKQIIVTVPRKGISTGQKTVKIEVDGFVGEACKNATKAVENAIGTNREYEDKPELYDTTGGVETISE